MSAAYGERRGDELADGGAKWDVTVVNVKSCLGLIHATAASAREEPDDQRRYDQADERGDQDEPQACRRITQQKVTAPGDGHAKRDHRKPREHSDEDGKE